MVATVRLVALQWQRAIFLVGGGRPLGDVFVARFLFVWAQVENIIFETIDQKDPHRGLPAAYKHINNST